MNLFLNQKVDEAYPSHPESRPQFTSPSKCQNCLHFDQLLFSTNNKLNSIKEAVQAMQLDELFKSSWLKTCEAIQSSQAALCDPDCESITRTPWPDFSQLHYPKISTTKLISNYNNSANTQSSFSYMSVSNAPNAITPNSIFSAPSSQNSPPSGAKHTEKLFHFRPQSSPHPVNLSCTVIPKPPPNRALPTSLMLMDKLYNSGNKATSMYLEWTNGENAQSECKNSTNLEIELLIISKFHGQTLLF